MDLETLLTAATAQVDGDSAGLLRVVRMPSRRGGLVQPDPPLPQPLQGRLEAMGITGLWTHQAEALAAARARHNVVVSTGTASGKSLCFNLPVIEALLADRRARALYLYPTKALAHDQLRGLRAFAIPQVTPATFDGDTPQAERATVRRYARIVLSNPDMVHYGMLAAHSRGAAAFADQGIRSIAFTKSRKAAELVAKHARGIVSSPETSDRIRAYRAGYLASERREIERQLFSGELLGVAATSALELGIDVGGLDAVVMNGFPGTVAQVWQQAGRAGRSRQESAAVLVGQEDPLDQYYLSHPDVLLAKPFEAAIVDVTNPRILEPHLGCAAHELPMEAAEVGTTFGEAAVPLAEMMVARGDLAERRARPQRGPGASVSGVAERTGPQRGPGASVSGVAERTGAAGPVRLHWRRREAPGRELDLRSLGGEAYRIVDSGTGSLLGTVDAARAHGQVHPGAVYLHQGESFVVVALDLAARVALVEPATLDYYTQARQSSDLRVVEPLASKALGRVECSLGRVEVTRQVVAYARRAIASGELLDVVPLELPAQTLPTVAFWYTVGKDVVVAARIRPPELPGALHAAEHAGIGVLPLFAMADRWDIGGVSTALSFDTALPTVFIYDGYPGGIGIAERGYARAEDHMGATLEVVRTCPCESGCPSCVQSPKCGNGNEPLDKAAAVRLMATILDWRATSGG